MFVWIIIKLEYDRIDISDGIDVDKTDRSRECMFCHYWYFLNKNFKHGPYFCDVCYHIVQKSTDFKNIAIAHVKKMHAGFIFHTWISIKQKKSMNKFDLIDKTGSIINCND